MVYLLDSTVLIDYLRGRPAADRIDALQSAQTDILCTTAINAEEISRGLRTRERAAAKRLFDGLVVAPLGIEEGWRAGQWRQHFATRGTTLAQTDCLIAAAAFKLRARLATGNPKDFPMTEIEVEHWPVGT